MGHLLSRAFKRLTQGNGQSRSQVQEQQNDREQQDKGHNSNNTNSNSGPTGSRPLTQSIPVGQSLDSADYAEFDTSDTRTRIKTTTTTTARIDEENSDALNEASAICENSNGDIGTSEAEKQGVEEAVIKIQALVRGHLARKALKDAHQSSVPPPNALGQSQFDENSLLRDPPSAIFSQLISSSSDESQTKQPKSPANNNNKIQATSGIESQRTSLDPIAEVPIENSSHTTTKTTTTSSPSTTNTTTTIADKQPQTSNGVNYIKNEEDKKKLSLICSRTASSPSQLETPRTDSANRDSLSPVPSEANASIDLNCDTPASASINIGSSNIIPTGNMASVLHHRLDDCNDRARELAEAAVAVADDDDDDDYDDIAQVEITRGHHDEEEPSSGMRLTINENGVSGTPDSLESEEAAAIRIQSAFRGYRSRKNSPYRTRSPNSSISRQRNALIQQEATILDEIDEPLSAEAAARVSNEAELAGQGIVGSAEVSRMDNETSVLPSEERRSSRTRQRDCSEITEQQQHLNQRIPSADEFTATEDDTTQTSTIRSVLGQHQKSHNESALEPDGDAKTDGNSDIEKKVAQIENEEPSFSLEIEESSEPNTMDELAGISSALETAQLTASASTNGNDKVISKEEKNHSMPIARPSIGSKSEASVETYDTDSSILGAALSLNEDLSVAELSRGSEILVGPTTTTTEQQTIAPTSAALDTIDEGKSPSEQINDDQSSSCRPDELVVGEQHSEGGALISEESIQNVLDEQEQRAIEMESDDIERRDPRGHVSEERAKSPQIRLDEPQFVVSGLDGDRKQASEGDEKKETTTSTLDASDNLSPGHGDDSGRSTPALNSSAANSSSEDDSDQAQNNGAKSPSGTDDATKKQQQSASKNKKRNNRNKRKGGKK